MAGGQASFPLAGTAVYMTSYPRLKKSNPWEKKITERKWLYQSPLDILIKASNGASDYGNKFGQPLICGSVLTFEHEENELSHGYDKVIMMAGGIGFGNKINSIKKKIKKGDCIVVLGGDNYRIGMGGSSVSSVATGEYGNKIELNAVQRANPEMQKRAFNVIRALGEENINPILSIHDHGAGGHLNCLSELLEDSGGVINIKNLPVGDPTLSEKEIIGNESQERMGLIIKKKDLNKVALIAKRERSPFYHVGIATEDNKLIFKGVKEKNPIDLSVDDFFGSSPKTIIKDKTIHNEYKAPKYHQTNLIKYLENSGIETRPVMTGNFVMQPVTDIIQFKSLGKLNNATDVMQNSFSGTIPESICSLNLDIINSKQRDFAGQTAPANGLYLKKIEY